MKELIAFTEYLEATGHSIGDLTFDEAIALHNDVKRVINKHFSDELQK